MNRQKNEWIKADLMVEMADPLGELSGIRDGGRQEDVMDVIRK